MEASWFTSPNYLTRSFATSFSKVGTSERTKTLLTYLENNNWSNNVSTQDIHNEFLLVRNPSIQTKTLNTDSSASPSFPEDPFDDDELFLLQNELFVENEDITIVSDRISIAPALFDIGFITAEINHLIGRRLEFYGLRNSSTQKMGEDEKIFDSLPDDFFFDEQPSLDFF